jgi:hypothetical protein
MKITLQRWFNGVRQEDIVYTEELLEHFKDKWKVPDRFEPIEKGETCRFKINNYEQIITGPCSIKILREEKLKRI